MRSAVGTVKMQSILLTWVLAAETFLLLLKHSSLQSLAPHPPSFLPSWLLDHTPLLSRQFTSGVYQENRNIIKSKTFWAYRGWENTLGLARGRGPTTCEMQHEQRKNSQKSLDAAQLANKSNQIPRQGRDNTDQKAKINEYSGEDCVKIAWWSAKSKACLCENDSPDTIGQNGDHANSFHRAHASISRESDVRREIICIFFMNFFFGIPFLKQ